VPSAPPPKQTQSQSQVVAQQQARLSDLEASARQWEERCAELRDGLAVHEQVGGVWLWHWLWFLLGWVGLGVSAHEMQCSC